MSGNNTNHFNDKLKSTSREENNENPIPGTVKLRSATFGSTVKQATKPISTPSVTASATSSIKPPIKKSQTFTKATTTEIKNSQTTTTPATVPLTIPPTPRKFSNGPKPIDQNNSPKNSSPTSQFVAEKNSTPPVKVSSSHAVVIQTSRNANQALVVPANISNNNNNSEQSQVNEALDLEIEQLEKDLQRLKELKHKELAALKETIDNYSEQFNAQIEQYEESKQQAARQTFKTHAERLHNDLKQEYSKTQKMREDLEAKKREADNQTDKLKINRKKLIQEKQMPLLVHFVRNNKLDELKKAIQEFGFNVNTQTANGNTLLHIALCHQIENINIEMVSFLLEESNALIKNNNNVTARTILEAKEPAHTDTNNYSKYLHLVNSLLKNELAIGKLHANTPDEVKAKIADLVEDIRDQIKKVSVFTPVLRSEIEEQIVTFFQNLALSNKLLGEDRSKLEKFLQDEERILKGALPQLTKDNLDTQLPARKKPNSTQPLASSSNRNNSEYQAKINAIKEEERVFNQNMAKAMQHLLEKLSDEEAKFVDYFGEIEKKDARQTLETQRILYLNNIRDNNHKQKDISVERILVLMKIKKRKDEFSHMQRVVECKQIEVLASMLDHQPVDMKKLEQLIDEFNFDQNTRNEKGQTLLHILLNRPLKEIDLEVSFFFFANINALIKDKDGNTAEDLFKAKNTVIRDPQMMQLYPQMIEALSENKKEMEQLPNTESKNIEGKINSLINQIRNQILNPTATVNKVLEIAVTKLIKDSIEKIIEQLDKGLTEEERMAFEAKLQDKESELINVISKIFSIAKKENCTNGTLKKLVDKNLPSADQTIFGKFKASIYTKFPLKKGGSREDIRHSGEKSASSSSLLSTFSKKTS